MKWQQRNWQCEVAAFTPTCVIAGVLLCVLRCEPVATGV